jgi:hypothetical protein
MMKKQIMIINGLNKKINHSILEKRFLFKREKKRIKLGKKKIKKPGSSQPELAWQTITIVITI